MNSSTSILRVALFLSIVHILNGGIVFQKPTGFGTMQVQLTTTTGFISIGTSNTFSFANPGYSNISSLGLALCGYDIPSPITLQFKAEIGFDNAANAIIILIIPINTTKVAFLNYFAIITTREVQSFLYVQNSCIQPANAMNSSMFQRSQTYAIPSLFVANSTSTITPIPYVRSVNSVVAVSFNFLHISSIVSLPAVNQFNITLLNNYSYLSEVCLSIVCYWNNIGSRFNLLNVSYSNNFLIINSSSPTQNLASTSQKNFTLNNAYGPIFNGKCIVGFQSFQMSSTVRQTISFNLSGNGIYGIISSSNYIVRYSWFCMAQITCPGATAQYYPAINDCEAICTIKNCTTCDTSTSCIQCNPGFYIDSLQRCSNCMPNCNNCTNPRACNQCATSFFYNSTVCLTCPQFCVTCTMSSCSLCQYGYYPNVMQCIKCSSVLSNCQHCLTGTSCLSCPTGYYPSGLMKGCALCNQTTGCILCNSSTLCTLCRTGYYLLGGTCKSCVITIAACCSFYIPNCSACKTQTSCKTCQGNYYLANSNQSCILCSNSIPNCLFCSNALTCTSCNVSNFLTTSKQCLSCISFIIQCYSCVNQTYCTECISPFIMVNGTCLNCPLWPTNNLYFLDFNNICQPCSTIDPNCIRCSQQQICVQCSDLYFLNQNNGCQLCSDYLSHCLSCSSSTACNLCQSGYFPDANNNTNCLLCSSKVNYCTSCSNALSTATYLYSLVCMGCENEYYLNSSECTPCLQSIPFCLICLNNFQCSLCSQGYFLSSTKTCITCGLLIPGCKVCQSSSVCLSCTDGYYLINSYCTQCKMALNNCFSCGLLNTTLTCSSCLPGYYLGLNFTCFLCNSTLQFCSACTSSLACTACLSGYLVNFNKTCSLCSTLIPYCSYCTQTTCIKCIDNYLLSNYGQCQSCTQFLGGCQICAYTINNITLQSQLNCTICSTGFLLYFSGQLAKCVACNISITNCISCVNLTYCSKCNNLSFINSKNTCSLCSIYLPNCIYCNGSSICLTCANNYYLNLNQTCEYCDPNQFGTDGTVLKLSICLSCRYISKIATCMNCIPGYFASQNSCVSCAGLLPNCISCATKLICIQCQPGYYLSANNAKCINCPPALLYCSSCDISGNCLVCNQDCYLNKTSNMCNKCYQITAYCNSCKEDGTCLGCQDGFYLSGFNCIRCSDIIVDCLLCSNQVICLLYNSNSTVSSSSSNILTKVSSDNWMYITFGSVGILLLLGSAFIIWNKYSKRKNQQGNEYENGSKFNTQRQFTSQESKVSNDVKIDHVQFCQRCKINKFDVMNIELLCVGCQARKKDGRQHIIRKEVSKKKEKKSNKPKVEKPEKKKQKLSKQKNEQMIKSQVNTNKIKKSSRIPASRQPQFVERQLDTRSEYDKKIKTHKKQIKSHL